MVQDSLVEYISSQLKAGVPRDAVRAALVGVGWQAVDIDDTFKKVEGPAVAVAAPVTPAASVAPVTSVKPISAAPATVNPVVAKPAEPQTIRVSDLVSAPTQSLEKKPDAAVLKVQPTITGPVKVEPAKIEPAKVDLMKIEPMKTDVKKVEPAKIVAGPVTVAPAKIEPAKMDSVKASPLAAKAAPVGPVKVEPMKLDMKKDAATPIKVMGSGAHSGMGLVWGVIAVVLILGLGGFAGYLYMQNRSLAEKMGPAAAGGTDLASQVAALNASNTALSTQFSSLSNEMKEYATLLSFYAVPPDMAVTSTPVTLEGTISGGGKVPYVITNDEGVKVFINNSSNAGVVAALASFVGSSSTEQFSGTYIPGAPSMTLQSVNGTQIVSGK